MIIDLNEVSCVAYKGATISAIYARGEKMYDCGDSPTPPVPPTEMHTVYVDIDGHGLANGNVLGIKDGDLVKHGTDLCVLAVPSNGNYFECWGDKYYDTENWEWSFNPRHFIVSSDTTIKAYFTNNEDDLKSVAYKVDIVSVDNCNLKALGEVGLFSDAPGIAHEFIRVPFVDHYGTHTSAYTSQSCYGVWTFGVNDYQITTEAIPTKGEYEFVSWSDGSTQNPRTFTIDKNTEIKPIIKKI